MKPSEMTTVELLEDVADAFEIRSHTSESQRLDYKFAAELRLRAARLRGALAGAAELRRQAPTSMSYAASHAVLVDVNMPSGPATPR